MSSDALSIPVTAVNLAGTVAPSSRSSSYLAALMKVKNELLFRPGTLHRFLFSLTRALPLIFFSVPPPVAVGPAIKRANWFEMHVSFGICRIS